MVSLSVVDEDDRGRPEDEVMKGLVSAYESGGQRHKTPRFEPVNIPLPGSYRFTAELEVGGRTAHLTTYVYWTNMMYVFQAVAAEPAEPKVMAEVVKSFKLLLPVPPKR